MLNFRSNSTISLGLGHSVTFCFVVYMLVVYNWAEIVRSIGLVIVMSARFVINNWIDLSRLTCLVSAKLQVSTLRLYKFYSYLLTFCLFVTLQCIFEIKGSIIIWCLISWNSNFFFHVSYRMMTICYFYLFDPYTLDWVACDQLAVIKLEKHWEFMMFGLFCF